VYRATHDAPQTTEDSGIGIRLPKQYFRVDEVTEYFAILVRTVYRLIDEGELRRTKIRGCLRIPAWEIERYEKELRKRMELL